ncbi:hypothetical protein H9Q70_004499 [Fusarium xylarioides]|nr:hypothetical protein H9Q70_004499 [Fusarium xylarioides]KAG5780511.1 hypothetical protein H9Q73_005852 [Fusarium xylarioides]
MSRGDVPTLEDEALFDECHIRGRRLWAEFQERRNTNVPDEQLYPWAGKYTMKTDNDGLNPLDGAPGDVFNDGLSALKAIGEHGTWTITEVYSRNSTLEAYRNYIDATGTALVCAANDKREDSNGDNRMPFHNLITRVIADTIPHQRIRNPKWVVQDVMSNLETKNVMSRAFCDFNPNEGRDIVDVFPTNQDGDSNPIFFALLGTPNVKGILRMLTYYPVLFGHKTILMIRTTLATIGSPTLVIFLGPAERQDGQSLTVKRRVISDGTSGPEMKKACKDA